MRRLIPLIGLIPILALAFIAAAPAPIAARVRVVRAQEPGHVEIYARIAYADDFTAYTVAAACDGVVAVQSTRQLDEFSRAPELPVVWKQLPNCDYDVVALLHGKRGEVVARTPAIPVRILCVLCG